MPRATVSIWLALLAALLSVGAVLAASPADEVFALNERAVRLDAVGRYRESIPLYQQGIQLLEVHGPEGELSTLLLNLGNAYRALDRFAEAEAPVRRGLAIRERVDGPERARVGYALNMLGMVLMGLDRFAEAEPVLERALAIRERVEGPDAITTAQVHNNLALVYLQTGRPDRAESAARRSLEIRVAAVGSYHPEVARPLNTLALLAEQRQAYAEAEQLLRWALEVEERYLPADHPDIGLRLYNLGGVLLAQRRFDEAEAALRRALPIWEQAYGPQHRGVAASRARLAEALRGQGKDAATDDEGERRRLEEAVAAAEAAHGPQHGDVIDRLIELAEFYAAHGQLNLAARTNMRAFGIAEKVEPPVSARRERLLTGQAAVFRGLGVHDTARTMEAQAAYQRERLGAG